MAINTTPSYIKQPKTGNARFSTANTNRDGSGSLSTAIWTAPAEGSRIDQIQIQATGTTTAGMVRIYLIDASANIRAFREVKVTAITVDATTRGFSEILRNADGSPICYLGASESLKFAPHAAEQFDVIAFGGDYTA